MKLSIENEVEWRTGIEQLISRLKEEVSIEFENRSNGLELGTDLQLDIELTNEERAAVEWFCAHTALIRGVLEIEPKTRTITLDGEIEPVIFPF